MLNSEPSSDRQSRNQFRFRLILLLVVILLILLLARNCYPPFPSPDITPTAILTTTATLEPTSTITTQEPTWQRPLVIVAAYNTKPSLISPGEEFILELSLTNQGQTPARNIILAISTDDFIPLKTGGVLVLGELVSGEKKNISQPMVGGDSLVGGRIAPLVLNANYTDTKGKVFVEIFNLGINLAITTPTPLVYTPTLTTSPTQTYTPTPTITSSPTVTRRACTEYGQDHGTYWIVAGCDTLSRISQVTGISLEGLLAANPEIKDPDLIYPVQVIKLPER